MRSIALIEKCIPVLLGAVVAGCGADAPTAVEPDSTPQQARRAAATAAPIVVGGFSTPESTVHDARADVYLVSNVNGHPQGLTNNGFISRIAPDGTVLEREWIRGGQDGVTMHAPTGLVLVGDVL